MHRTATTQDSPIHYQFKLLAKAFQEHAGRLSSGYPPFKNICIEIAQPN